MHSRLSNFLLANRESCRGMGRKLFHVFIYMSWFNFILGLIFISLCFKLIITHYHAQKQREIKIKPRIKLNHNIYNVISVEYQKLGLLIKLFVVVTWKKCTGKLQTKRTGFSDNRSDRIKEWAETNIVHLTIVCRAYKWKTLKIVHC